LISQKAPSANKRRYSRTAADTNHPLAVANQEKKENLKARIKDELRRRARAAQLRGERLKRLLPPISAGDAAATAKHLQATQRKDPRLDKSDMREETVRVLRSALNYQWKSAGKEGNYPELMFHLFIKGRAVSTLNAYAGAFKRWEGFCKTEGIQRSLPVDGWDLANLICVEHARLDGEGKTASSIDNLVAGISYISKEAAGTSDPIKQPTAAGMLAAAQKSLGYKNVSKDPLMTEDLEKIYAEFSSKNMDLNRVRDLLGLAATHEGLLRWDDLVGLRVGRFLFTDKPDTPIRAFLVSAKTDHYKEGQWAIFSQREDACSTQQLLLTLIDLVNEAWTSMTNEERLQRKAWQDEDGQLCFKKLPLVFDVVKLTSGLMFPAHPELENLPATAARVKKFATKAYDRFRTHLKIMAKKVGLKGDYATHSGRRGGATGMLACGITERMVKAAGRWRSDKGFNRYIDFEEELRWRATAMQQRWLKTDTNIDTNTNELEELDSFDEYPADELPTTPKATATNAAATKTAAIKKATAPKTQPKKKASKKKAPANNDIDVSTFGRRLRRSQHLP
jgi:hypothetical protein